VEVAEARITHGDPSHGGHEETALVMLISFGERKGVTVAALPCGAVAPTELRI
jgi:hypothetical protein